MIVDLFVELTALYAYPNVFHATGSLLRSSSDAFGSNALKVTITVSLFVSPFNASFSTSMRKVSLPAAEDSQSDALSGSQYRAGNAEPLPNFVFQSANVTL